MHRSRLSLVNCFALLLALSGCSSPADDGTGGSGGVSTLPPSGAGTAGTVTGTSGGTPAAMGTSGSASVPTSGSSSGGTGATVAGSGSGGTGNVNPGSGGAPGPATGGTTPGPVGGAPNVQGGAPSTPTAGTAGAPADPNGPDQNGKTNVKPGTMSQTPLDYFKMGEIRVLNNNWGSRELGCGAASTMSIFVREDKSFGWTFNRQDCDTAGSNSKPDFPQVEFGIHPFGIGNSLATSPEFSSTTLLPLQIKDITSASVKVDNMSIQLQQAKSWNITFEFWLSQKDPKTQGDAGVYAELMTFWGWQPNRWPDTEMSDNPDGAGPNELVTSGGKTYKLWVQRDNWANGWRYYQFRDHSKSSNDQSSDGSSSMSFSGTVDVKALLDYLVNNRGYSKDLWVTRLEVGSEIDDDTQGTVTIQNITFEVNGQSRSPVFGQ